VGGEWFLGGAGGGGGSYAFAHVTPINVVCIKEPIKLPDRK